MPDVYASIEQAESSVLERLAEVLELRAADPQQRAIRDSYFSRLALPAGARVLEVGCGTGAVTRALAQIPAAGQVVGVDPSPVFVEKARALGADTKNLTFQVADARSLSFDDGGFDAVVFHTSLSHIPGPERALGEAYRVLVAGGQLAIFDGDFVTLTLATGPSDPLQACADAFVAARVHDPWLVRKLHPLVVSAGFEVLSLASHGYVEARDPGYMLVVADLGADATVELGRLGEEAAAGLKAEARRRASDGTFFGHIAYASLIARKPA